jgi:serine/threonine protein kinase
MKIVATNFKPVEGGYSTDLRELINRMLCRNPMQRPSSTEILKIPFLRPYMEAFVLEQSNRFPRLKVSKAVFVSEAGSDKIPPEKPSPVSLNSTQRTGFVYENDSLENS